MVKVGEGVWEKARSDKEKAEGPSSTEKEKREQTPLGKVHAELEAKAKDTAERHDQLLRLGAEVENYEKRMQNEGNVMDKLPFMKGHRCRGARVYDHFYGPQEQF